MAEFASLVASRVPSVFPKETDGLALDVGTSYSDAYVDVVDACMGETYHKVKGPNWREEKREELKAPGIVYISYSSLKTACFMAIRPVDEPFGHCLYLYEIQIMAEFQGKRLGSRLMLCFHNLAASLSEVPQFGFSAVGTALTVFAANERAIAFYRKLGYNRAAHSPRNRRLRNGKLLKPEYYIMERPNNGQTSNDIIFSAPLHS